MEKRYEGEGGVCKGHTLKKKGGEMREIFLLTSTPPLDSCESSSPPSGRQMDPSRWNPIVEEDYHYLHTFCVTATAHIPTAALRTIVVSGVELGTVTWTGCIAHINIHFFNNTRRRCRWKNCKAGDGKGAGCQF